MNADSSAIFDTVFGESSTGTSAEERARTSPLEFVRSLDQLTYSTPEAKGRRLTAFEALEAYGFDILRLVASEGYAVISANRRSAGRVINERRKRLGLDIRHVANSARVDTDVVQLVEEHKRVSIRKVEAIARALGLDERVVSWMSEPTSQGERVAIRLRTVGQDRPRMTSSVVAAIAEAAWVATTQLRLQNRLGMHASIQLKHSDNYGAPGYPPYQHGYFLAFQARKDLGLGLDRLPCSLREIAEERLGIPVIQAELGQNVAGVTIEFGEARAIVLNLGGKNRNVLIRRSTIAHELGHLLFDPPRQLDALRVDEYDEIDRAAHEVSDEVEQRANAFGVEFIAPQAAVVKCFDANKDDGVWAVMDLFGLSYTAARYQIWNGLKRRISLDEISLITDKRPDPKWEAGETYTIDYHPLYNLRSSRAGRFSAVVVRAAEESIISWDSGAAMLEVEENDLTKAIPAIKQLFPSVFPSG